jgi:hypothetical protein
MGDVRFSWKSSPAIGPVVGAVSSTMDSFMKRMTVVRPSLSGGTVPVK